MLQDESRGERTRTEIIHAACRLFLQNGFHGTSMRQIAREAGIAVGGIYNHFAGKEQIFLDVILKYHPIQCFTGDVIRPGRDVEEFVRDASANWLWNWPAQEFINLVFIELSNLKETSPVCLKLYFPRWLNS
jgi:AcrR family transcriptional regulator